MRIEGCIFVDTPRECRHIDIGRCLGGVEQLACIFNHSHLKIADDVKNNLIKMFRAELNSKNRYKAQSGLVGRQVT